MSAPGKWASAIVARLHIAGTSCKVLEQGNFEKSTLEKLIWFLSFESSPLRIDCGHGGEGISEQDIDALDIMKRRFNIKHWISDPCYFNEWEGIGYDNSSTLIRISKIKCQERT